MARGAKGEAEGEKTMDDDKDVYGDRETETETEGEAQQKRQKVYTTRQRASD